MHLLNLITLIARLIWPHMHPRMWVKACVCVFARERDKDSHIRHWQWKSCWNCLFLGTIIFQKAVCCLIFLFVILPQGYSISQRKGFIRQTSFIVQHIIKVTRAETEETQTTMCPWLTVGLLLNYEKITTNPKFSKSSLNYLPPLLKV